MSILTSSGASITASSAIVFAIEECEALMKASPNDGRALWAAERFNEVVEYQVHSPPTADRPVCIRTSQNMRAGAETLIFEAEDRSGPLAIWVAVPTWERLRSEALLYGDVDSLHGHMLNMLEVIAAEISPKDTHNGARLVFVDD